MTEICAPMQGTVIGVAAVGDTVDAGKAVVVIESMKISCPVETEVAGTVSSVLVTIGALVKESDALVVVDESTAPAAVESTAPTVAGDAVRADVAAVAERHARVLDDARPEAVEQRQRKSLDELNLRVPTGTIILRKELAAVADPDERERHHGFIDTW